MAEIITTPASADADTVVAAALGTPTPPDPSQGTPTPVEDAQKDPEAAADPVADGEAAKEAAKDPTEPAKTPDPEPTKPVDWRERRLGEVSAQKRELEARLAALEAAQGAKPAPSDPNATAKTYTEAELMAKANELASAKAADARFNDQCNAVYGQGNTKYGDFQATLQGFTQLGGLSRPFIEAVLQAGDKAPDVLYGLGKDLNEAARVMSLPPMEMAFELAKRALTPEAVAKGPTLSRAPAPLVPKVGGNGRADPSVYDDTISMADWVALRNKQLSGKGLN